MSIRSKRDLDVGALGKLEEFKIRINLSTIFTQARSIQFNTGVGAFACGKEIHMETGGVTLGAVSEFFGGDIEGSMTFRVHLGKYLGPNGISCTFGKIQWPNRIL